MRMTKWIFRLLSEIRDEAIVGEATKLLESLAKSKFSDVVSRKKVPISVSSAVDEISWMLTVEPQKAQKLFLFSDSMMRKKPYKCDIRNYVDEYSSPGITAFIYHAHLIIYLVTSERINRNDDNDNDQCLFDKLFLETIIIGPCARKLRNIIGRLSSKINYNKVIDSPTCSCYQLSSRSITRVACKPYYKIFFNGKDELFSEVDKLLGYSAKLLDMGIDSTIGILLYGKPGTGKSSIAKAIASTNLMTVVNCDISAIPPQQEGGQVGLFNIISSTSHRLRGDILYLFDDCDVMLGSNNGKRSPYLTQMLQILDGTAFEEGRNIVVLTTNHIERLDDAIMRSGRINIKMEIGDINEECAIKLCESLGADPKIILKDVSYPVNPAWLQDECIKSIM